jgi:ABC-type xylose transport system permease subunit
MARVAEFSGSNVARLLLAVFIVVALLLAVGSWVFYSPGAGSTIAKPAHATIPSK